MSQENQTDPISTALNRIPPETSWLTRRFAAILVGIWFGGILVVAIGAPAAFRSVDEVIQSPPPNVTKALGQLGPSLTRQILHYQVGEANRLMFDAWGLTQTGLALTVFLLLLFLSSVGRPALGLSLIMLLMSLLMQFVLIPRISEAGRELETASQAGSAEVTGRFRMMHLGFTAFELTVVALGSILLFLLLRSRSGSSRHRKGYNT